MMKYPIANLLPSTKRLLNYLRHFLDIEEVYFHISAGGEINSRDQLSTGAEDRYDVLEVYTGENTDPIVAVIDPLDTSEEIQDMATELEKEINHALGKN